MEIEDGSIVILSTISVCDVIAGLTITEQVATFPPADAEIVAVPAEWATTIPF